MIKQMNKNLLKFYNTLKKTFCGEITQVNRVHNSIEKAIFPGSQHGFIIHALRSEIWAIDSIINSIVSIISPSNSISSIAYDTLYNYDTTCIKALMQVAVGTISYITVYSYIGTDIPANPEIATTIAEINRLLSQLDGFIDAFNEFVSGHDFNVVIEDGRIGVDTGSSVSDQVAQTWANRVSVLNDLIHDRYTEVERLLTSISESSQYLDLLARFEAIASKYRHWH